jgi:hypothetical protein
VSATTDPAERVRKLLLRGDNALKTARPERLPRALAAFEEARDVAGDPAVDETVRELIERRIVGLRALLEARDA